MFEFIRNNRRFLQFVMLVLIVPSFVFFGIQGYNRMGDGDNLASIGQQNISQAEFDNAMRNQLERIKQIVGANYDAKQYDTPEARQNMLDNLIAQKVVAIEAQRANLMGSDDKLRELIKALPGVYSDGKLDMEAYKRAASAQGLSPDGYEAKTRVDLGVQALASTLQNTTAVPSTLVDSVAIAQERTHTVQELLFKPETYAANVKFEAADVEKFYNDKRKQFELPERAKFEYVVFDTASVAKNITISDADLKAYYEQNKGRLGTPEERQASHILIKTAAKASDADVAAAKTKAEALAAQAKKDPASFAKLAKDSSEDPGSAAQGGDLGFFKREAMVKPFSDAAFGMKEGEISAPVKSDFGWHVIRLVGIKPANVKSLEAAKPELELEMKNQQASKKFAEQTEQFSNLVYEQGDSFKAVAEKLKLEVKTQEGMTREAMKQTKAGTPNANPFNEKLANALFSDESIKGKKNTEAVEVAKGTLVSARMVEYVASKTMPLADVKASVEAQLRQDLARKQAKTEGEAKLKALEAAPKGAVEGLSANKDVSKQKPEGLPAEAINAVLRAASKPLPAWAGVTLPNGQYALYKVSAIGATPALDDAKRNAVQANLKRAYSEQELQSVIAVLRERHNVKILKKPSAEAARPAHSANS